MLPNNLILREQYNQKNMIAKSGLGCLCMRKENHSFKNNYII